jgi:hypothetical protein
MIRRIRASRPSPAIVVAILALVAAVAGTAVAEVATTARLDKKEKKQVKKIAKKQINKLAPGLSVAHADTADTADNATNAQNAQNASRLGGTSAGAYQQESDLLFATVAPAGVNPAIVRGRGATAVTRVNPGAFNVRFNRVVTGCTWLATYGFSGNGSVDPLFAAVRGTASNNVVEVVIFDDTGAQVDGLGFHVEVLCP